MYFCQTLPAKLHVYKRNCWLANASVFMVECKCTCECLYCYSQTWFNATRHPQHQWRSIYLFFGKDFLLSQAVPSIHDIYEAPTSPGTCCPDNWDHFNAMTTKRQNTVTAKCEWPAANKAVPIVQKRAKQNLNTNVFRLIRRENTRRELIRREDKRKTSRGVWLKQKQSGKESSFPC